MKKKNQTAQEMTDYIQAVVHSSMLGKNATYLNYNEMGQKEFAKIRSIGKLSLKQVIDSVCAEGNLKYTSTPGRSGAIIWFTLDGLFVLKSVSSSEASFLMTILGQYEEHLRKNPNSLLSRFYGLYKLNNVEGKPIRVILMNNVFLSFGGRSGNDKVEMIESYDLKGSKVHRFATPEEHQKKQYKDQDILGMKRSMYITLELQSLLVKQIQSDTNFLAKMNIMDYSFLVGLHKTIESGTEANVSGSTINPPLLFQFMKNVIRTDEYYMVGIIDILQEYNMKKKAERLIKSTNMNYNKDELSVIPPATYAKRFCDFLEDILRFGHKDIAVAESKYSNTPGSRESYLFPRTSRRYRKGTVTTPLISIFQTPDFETPVPEQTAQNSTVDNELKMLDYLHMKKILSDEEYELKKKQLGEGTYFNDNSTTTNDGSISSSSAPDSPAKDQSNDDEESLPFPSEEFVDSPEESEISTPTSTFTPTPGGQSASIKENESDKTNNKRASTSKTRDNNDIESITTKTEDEKKSQDTDNNAIHGKNDQLSKTKETVKNDVQSEKLEKSEKCETEDKINENADSKTDNTNDEIRSQKTSPVKASSSPQAASKTEVKDIPKEVSIKLYLTSIPCSQDSPFAISQGPTKRTLYKAVEEISALRTIVISCTLPRPADGKIPFSFNCESIGVDKQQAFDVNDGCHVRLALDLDEQGEKVFTVTQQHDENFPELKILTADNGDSVTDEIEINFSGVPASEESPFKIFINKQLVYEATSDMKPGQSLIANGSIPKPLSGKDNQIELTVQIPAAKEPFEVSKDFNLTQDGTFFFITVDDGGKAALRQSKQG